MLLTVGAEVLIVYWHSPLSVGVCFEISRAPSRARRVFLDANVRLFNGRQTSPKELVQFADLFRCYLR